MKSQHGGRSPADGDGVEKGTNFRICLIHFLLDGGLLLTLSLTYLPPPKKVGLEPNYRIPGDSS